MSKTVGSSSTRPRASQGTSKKGGEAGSSKDSGRGALRRSAYGASSGSGKDRARELIDSRLARIGFVLTCLFGLSGFLSIIFLTRHQILMLTSIFMAPAWWQTPIRIQL